jgi:hypothetical protein
MPFALAILFVILAVPSPLGAPQRTAAVVDFYVLSPVPFVDGLFPGRFVADTITGMLPQASHDDIVVIHRRDVRRAEQEVDWQDSDVLRFARLSELGRAMHADRLVVGWIERLDLSDGGVRIGFPRIRSHPVSGFATVRIQVFDVAQGRIVAQAAGSAYGMGMTLLFAAEQALRDAAARALPGVIAHLLAP